MRNSTLLLLLIATGASCPGQTPNIPAGSEWSHVMALAPGTKIHVAASPQTMDCRVKSVDADGLVCQKRSGEVNIARKSIARIQIVERGKSAVLAGAIGAGAGFGIDVVLSKGIFRGGTIKGSVADASGGVGALVLAPVGYFGGWIRHTIYTAAP